MASSAISAIFAAISFLILIFVTITRSTYKFCNQCGKFDRANRLRIPHFIEDHKTVPKEELGFLKVDELPVTGVEEVKMKLRLIGITTPAPTKEEESENRTVTELELEDEANRSEMK